MAGLDLLRFFAAVGVMLSHYGESFYPESFTLFSETGRVCVQLFFIISGTVIMQTASAAPSGGVFIWQRMLRLYPAFLFSIFVTSALILARGGHISILEFLGNLTMLGRLFQIKLIDGVYWTLSYEWSFYAMVAIFLPWFKTRQQHVIIIWLMLTTIFVGMHIYNRPFDILTNIFFAQAFCAGMVIQMYHNADISLRRMLQFFAGILLSFAIKTLIIDPATSAFEVTLFGIEALLVLWSSRVSFPAGFARIAMIAGAISYPLYLIHYQVLDVIAPAELSKPAIITISGAIAIIYAYLISQYWEAPLRRKLRSLRSVSAQSYGAR